MRICLLLLLFSLTLASCGAAPSPAPPPEEAPVETARPEEVPVETLPPEAPAPTLSPLEGTPLTEEELAQAEEAFHSRVHPSDRSLELGCFFTSTYADVTELDLKEFLFYYFFESQLLEDGDAEEFLALAALPGFPFTEVLEDEGPLPSGVPAPIHRIPRSAVDKTLETYAGITTADLKNTENVLYLPDYDAYYNFTSDYGPGWFQPVEGARDGDTVRLRSQPMGHMGTQVVQELTLREEGDRWLIRSFTFLPTGNS